MTVVKVNTRSSLLMVGDFDAASTRFLSSSSTPDYAYKSSVLEGGDVGILRLIGPVEKKKEFKEAMMRNITLRFNTHSLSLIFPKNKETEEDSKEGKCVTYKMCDGLGRAVLSSRVVNSSFFTRVSPQECHRSLLGRYDPY